MRPGDDVKRLLTDGELCEAADRAIDRALQWVLGDDMRLDARQRYRMHDVIRAMLDQLEKNLSDNGQGVVRLQVDMIFGTPGDVPALRVRCARKQQQAQAR